MNTASRRYVALMGRYLSPLWKPMVALSLLVLATIGLQLAGPQLLGGFIDAVQRDGPIRRLLVRGVAFVAIAVVAQATSLLTIYIAETVSW
jgi:ATP-binding cassette, subfamily B, bacterial